jgi:hypothetical protein
MDIGNLFGGAEPAPEQAAQSVYYTNVDGLKLYAEPRFSSAVVRTLPLHQKVYRDQLERGFAHVRVDGSRDQGWVDNAALTWRLPASPAKATSPKVQPPAPAAAREPIPSDATSPDAAPEQEAAPIPSDPAASGRKATSASSEPSADADTADSAAAPKPAEPVEKSSEPTEASTEDSAPTVDPKLFDPF